MLIVIGTDGSPSGHAAVEHGAELARLAGADVLLVTVRAAPPMLLGDPHYQRRVRDDFVRSRVALADAHEELDELGLDYESELLEGSPAEELLRIAEARDADLVVVGSRGRGPVRAALLGSVFGEVAARARMPVLIVPPRAASGSDGGDAVALAGGIARFPVRARLHVQRERSLGKA